MSNIAFVRSISDRISENVEKVILGKHKEVQITLMALLCEGHILIEDVPGVGKTMLARRNCALHWLRLSAHPVHARHVALGRDRCIGFQPENDGVRVPSWPDHDPDRADG